MGGPWWLRHGVDDDVLLPLVTFSPFPPLTQKPRVHSRSLCVLLRHETRETVLLRFSRPLVGLNSVLVHLQIYHVTNVGCKEMMFPPRSLTY